MDKAAIIILAAGNSSRLGRPKQMLHFQGRSMIRKVVCEAAGAGLDPVIVVTGAYVQELSAELAADDVLLCHNEEWKKGMGQGISRGLSALLEADPLRSSVIIAVCDQPFVSSGLFGQLLRMQEEIGKGIVACSYAGTIGTPVLFSSKYFGELLELGTVAGAKHLLDTYRQDVAEVLFPEGNIDIDTESDYRRLIEEWPDE